MGWKIDAAALVADFVSPIPFTGDVIRFAGSKVTEGGDRADAAAKHEEFLNMCIRAGAFDMAERYIEQDIKGMSEHAKQQMVAELRNIRRKVEPELKKYREWNDRVTGLLAEGKTNEAIRFVKSLNLSWDRQQQIIDGIEKATRELEDRQAQAERWLEELNELLRNQKFKKARKFVESLPIEQKAKDAILAQIPKVGWFS